MRRVAGDIYGGALRGSPDRAREELRHVRWSSDYGYYLQLIGGLRVDQPALAAPAEAAHVGDGGH